MRLPYSRDSSRLTLASRMVLMTIVPSLSRGTNSEPKLNPRMVVAIVMAPTTARVGYCWRIHGRAANGYLEGLYALRPLASRCRHVAPAQPPPAGPRGDRSGDPGRLPQGQHVPAAPR